MKTTSANSDVKIYIGALAGHDGAGYVDADTLAGYIKEARETWSSFGGVMLWEASVAVGGENLTHCLWRDAAPHQIALLPQ